VQAFERHQPVKVLKPEISTREWNHVYFQEGRVVTKLLPFEYRIYIIFDIELTNQATMSVAGRRRTISSTTWDLKGQRETAVH
jgi:hypothetical protein